MLKSGTKMSPKAKTGIVSIQESPPTLMPKGASFSKVPQIESTLLLNKIGSSMMIKSGSVQMIKVDEPMESKLYGGLTAYRERGRYLHRLEQFREAKMAYDEAFKFAPENIDLLIRRSNTCIADMYPDLALKDANAALYYDPNNIRALHAKAKAMAVKRQFERSILLNYQGLERRRQPSYFAEGISDCMHCIEEAVGTPAGQVLVDFLPSIKKNLEPVNDALALKQVKHVSRIPHIKHAPKLTQLEAHRHKILSRVLAYKYLGPMAEDKFFLENLLTDPRINSANSVGSKKIREYTEAALRKIEARQQVLREQRPYYTIRNAEKTESKHETRHKKELLINERQTNERNASQMVKKIEQCMRSHRINEMMTQAKRAQAFLDSKSTYTFTTKHTYIDRLYRAIGEGYLSQYRLSYNLSERGNRRRIAFLMGISVGRATSYDSVLASYPYNFVDPRESIKKMQADLEVCENPIMKCWLYYELSRLMCTVKNFVKSKTYAKQCQHEAEALQNPTWWLNGCFALIGGDMQQGNCNEVKEQTREALEWAKQTSKPERIMAFLEKCAEMTVDLVGTSERKAIEKRENEILSIVHGDIKEDFKYLFKRISRVPVGRRFSVIPQKGDNSKRSERSKHQQRHLSVIPGPAKSLPRLSHTVVPGLQIFEI